VDFSLFKNFFGLLLERVLQSVYSFSIPGAKFTPSFSLAFCQHFIGPCFLIWFSIAKTVSAIQIQQRLFHLERGGRFSQT
jgi:hypothetical protein